MTTTMMPSQKTITYNLKNAYKVHTTLFRAAMKGRQERYLVDIIFYKGVDICGQYDREQENV